MSSEDEFNVNGFYQNLGNGELKAVRCKSCQRFVMPPSPVCNKCFSRQLEWTNLKGSGRIVSFSEVHVSNDMFKAETPYVVAVVEMDEGVRMTGIVRNVSRLDVDSGTRVYIRIDKERSKSWPPRVGYYFSKDAA